MNVYKAGDKVVIRKDLKVGEWYGDIYWWDYKTKLINEDYVTINFVDTIGHYQLDFKNLWVSDEMISYKYN